jgi:hypothetical protein
MTSLRVVIAAAALAGAAPALAAGPDEIVIPRNNVIAAQIGGQPVRLRVDPGAPIVPILNPALAERLKVKPLRWARIVGQIGPARVNGRTAVLRFRLPGSTKEKKARIVWFDRNFVEGADGAVNPLFLIQNKVRFELPGRGGRVNRLPYGSANILIRGTRLAFAGETVTVRYDLFRTESAATADTARLVAAERDGKLTAGSGSTMIAFGIARPYREMRLARPLEIGPFDFTTLRVRVPDQGAIGIAEEDADPDEIVVQGKRKSKARREFSIARDRLDRCAWIETDRAAKTIRFDCPAG